MTTEMGKTFAIEHKGEATGHVWKMYAEPSTPHEPALWTDLAEAHADLDRLLAQDHSPFEHRERTRIVEVEHHLREDHSGVRVSIVGPA